VKRHEVMVLWTEVEGKRRKDGVLPRKQENNSAKEDSVRLSEPILGPLADGR
jgi:hypothetical protein